MVLCDLFVLFLRIFVVDYGHDPNAILSLSNKNTKYSLSLSTLFESLIFQANSFASPTFLNLIHHP